MPWFPKNEVLVPVDFSEMSFEAVEVAKELVSDTSHLHVIHVLPVLAGMEVGVVWDTVSDDSRQERAGESLRKKFKSSDYPGMHFAVAFGDPGREIASHAEHLGADLVVIPSHGRTGLKRLLIGSVAERVCQLAHCPVLVLRR